jgi:phenylpropionate dioxygenase-like ring-hydroxylating dioxygenase large terminal subunit
VTITAGTGGNAGTGEPPVGLELAERALALIDADTTEMASDVLHVPLSYYRDPDLHSRERELCRSTPLALVPSAQVPSRHDFVVREVLGTSVLITRGSDGLARAFLNYCRHRGAKPAEGCGSTRRFTCPYHAWSYDNEGRLVGVPGDAGFDGLDRGRHGLVELPSEERHGLVWVVLTAGAPIDVAAHLGSLDAELAGWNLGTNEYLTEREISGAVNWKAAIEAFAENYHFPYVHRNSIVGQNTVANTAIYDEYGQHHRLGFPCPWIIGARGAQPGQLAISSPLDVMVFIYWIFPNLTLAMSPVGTEIIDILPGVEPGQTVLRHGWMASTPAPDQSTRQGYRDLYELVHAAVRDEDFAVLPGCGQASRQGEHSHMVIGRNEIGVQHVVRTFTDALQGPR